MHKTMSTLRVQRCILGTMSLKSNQMVVVMQLFGKRAKTLEEETKLKDYRIVIFINEFILKQLIR